MSSVAALEPKPSADGLCETDESVCSLTRFALSTRAGSALLCWASSSARVNSLQGRAASRCRFACRHPAAAASGAAASGAAVSVAGESASKSSVALSCSSSASLAIWSQVRRLVSLAFSMSHAWGRKLGPRGCTPLGFMRLAKRACCKCQKQNDGLEAKWLRGKFLVTSCCFCLPPVSRGKLTNQSPGAHRNRYTT